MIITQIRLGTIRDQLKIYESGRDPGQLKSIDGAACLHKNHYFISSETVVSHILQSSVSIHNSVLGVFMDIYTRINIRDVGFIGKLR